MRQLASDLLERFETLCKTATRPIGLAVSGGSDSMALLHLALDWTSADRLLVFTVDHGLRPEARDEVNWVADQCARLRVGHQMLTWTPPVGHVSQARARDARHRLLAGALAARGGSHLLLGHTLDDQYETIAMRAKRGARGLAGMRTLAVSPVWPEGRGIVLARPLLGCRRADLRACLSQRSAHWVEDPSNENRTFERVRVRQTLSNLGSDVSQIAKTHEAAQAARRGRDLLLAAWMTEHVEMHEDGLIVCTLGGLSEAEFADGLSDLLLAASGSDRPASLAGRQALAKDIFEDEHGWRSRTLGGAWLAPRGGRVHIACDPGQVPASPDLSVVETLGHSLIWGGRFEIGPKGMVEGGKGRDEIAVSALSRASFPAFENKHALLRCLVGDRLNAVIRVLEHEV